MYLDKDVVKQAAMENWELVMHPYDTLIHLNSGFDAVWAFSMQLNGCQIYVPTVRKIFDACLKAEAKKEFNAHRDVAAAAKKYGFSPRHFRRIIKDM